MDEASSVLVDLHDQRLAVHATSAAPVWLWSPGGSRILWANPVGAAVFEAPTPAALSARRFKPDDPLARQVAAVSASLFPGGKPRLERLRGFGAGLGRTVLCACSRLALDRATGILVVAIGPVGRPMPLAERVRRLYAGTDQEIAAFMPDGTLVFATAGVQERLGWATTGFGAEGLVAAARDAGHACGETSLGRVSVRRIGSESAVVLVMTFESLPPTEPPVVRAAETAPSAPEPPGGRETMLDIRQEAVPPACHADLPGQDREPNFASPSDMVPTPPLRIDAPPFTRRYPLRFIWQMDADGRFTLGSDDFIEAIGPRTAVALGRPWKEIAAELALDPDGQVSRAVATRDTWSGVIVSWPIDSSEERLNVELSGLPVFDRNRDFLGYRGFGVCRDTDRIAALSRERRALIVPGADTAAPAQSEPQAGPPSSASADSPALEKIASSEEVGSADLEQSAPNVVPFRPPTDSKPITEARPLSLSAVEHSAFRELARQLSARLNGEEDRDGPEIIAPDEVVSPGSEHAQAPAARSDLVDAVTDIVPGAVDKIALDEVDAFAPARSREPEHAALLDHLSVGLLIYRFDQPLYANRSFLQATGYPTLAALIEAGGLGSLFIEQAEAPGEVDRPERSLTITTLGGDKLAAGLFSMPWRGESARVLMLIGPAREDRFKAVETVLRRAEAGNHELRSILDIAADGVIVLDCDGRITSSNRAAEALFGYEPQELAQCSLADLFAPEGKPVALEYFDRISCSGVASLLNDGREVMGRVRQGGLIPLFMSMGPIADGVEKFCAVFRDLTPWKKAEQDLLALKRQLETMSAAKSEFLNKISYEIRTPLNSIIGFSEMMLEERFGPIGNERYREYLKDICASGTHVVSFLADLLDLAKVKTGSLELNFASVNLNDVVQNCVTAMQPQASRARIIIRTSLSPSLPPLTADAGSVRQIILNVLSNAIELTGAGGQVIVSTGLNNGAVMLRVRDTGVGINAKDLETALQPFQQPATTPRQTAAGTGLGLPLTKALAEANRGTFTVTSKVHEGTLVEIAFPASRDAAE